MSAYVTQKLKLKMGKKLEEKKKKKKKKNKNLKKFYKKILFAAKRVV